MLMDIDLSKVNTRPLRLNISLPESQLRDIDRYAKSRHLTRSRFLAQAAMKAMAE
jgi:flagellin-like hook-associated protein FlgL